MFRIPHFNQMPEMTFEEAKGIIEIDGDLLKGMEHVSEHWDRYASGNADDMYADDDEFYDTWIYEVNAYNVVFNKMQPLLAGK